MCRKYRIAVVGIDFTTQLMREMKDVMSRDVVSRRLIN